MGKARNLAKILIDKGNLAIRSLANLSINNIHINTNTKHTRLNLPYSNASLITAQVGIIRINTRTTLIEYHDGVKWQTAGG